MTPNPSPLCLPRTPTTVPDCLTEQAVGEVGWANVWKTQGGVVRSLTNIHIFFVQEASDGYRETLLQR